MRPCEYLLAFPSVLPPHPPKPSRTPELAGNHCLDLAVHSLGQVVQFISAAQAFLSIFLAKSEQIFFLNSSFCVFV